MDKIKYTEEDKEFLKRVKEEGYYITELDRIPERRKYLGYKDVIIAAYSYEVPLNHSYDLRLINEELLDDRDVALAAVGCDGTSIRFVNPKFYNDEEIVKTAILNSRGVFGDKNIPTSIKKDKKFIMSLLDIKDRTEHRTDDVLSLKYVDDSLKDDKEVVLKAIKHRIYNYEYASERLKKDKEITNYILAHKKDKKILDYMLANKIDDKGYDGYELFKYMDEEDIINYFKGNDYDAKNAAYYASECFYIKLLEYLIDNNNGKKDDIVEGISQSFRSMIENDFKEDKSNTAKFRRKKEDYLDYFDFLKSILDFDDINPDNHNNVLFYASKCHPDNYWVFEYFINCGVNVNKKNSANETPLMYAAKYGTPKMISTLLEKGANINDTSDNGESALIWAEMNMRYANAKLLIDNNIDLNSKDKDGDTPLITLLTKNNLFDDDIDLMEYMIENGADKRAIASNGMNLVELYLSNPNPKYQPDKERIINLLK